MLFYVLSTLKSLTLAAQTLPIKREDTKIKNNIPLKFILITLLFLISENNSRKDWILSLRRPLKLKGIRRSFININTDKYPFWSYFIEKGNELKVTSVKPGVNLNTDYIKKVIKHARTTNALNEKNIKKLKNLDEIKIEGNDLLDIEFKREMGSQKKKILHKAFIDNGRIIFNTEINNVFGKETFYKNYDKNVYKPINTSYK